MSELLKLLDFIHVILYFLKVVSYLLHVAMQLSTSLKSPHNNIVL